MQTFLSLWLALVSRYPRFAAVQTLFDHKLLCVLIGIHLFMALYGLSVFLETPKELREGRRRYIALSFVFTLLATISASSDMASGFQILFRATTAVDFYKLVAEMNSFWLRYLTSATIHVAIFVGDALLVRFDLIQ